MKILYNCKMIDIDKNSIHNYDDSRHAIEVKEDGIWVQMVIDKKGCISFWSRSGKEKTHTSDLYLLALDAEKKFSKIKDSILIGELGYGSSRSTSEYEKLGHRFIRFWTILKLKGKDLQRKSDKERRNILEKVFKENGGSNKKFSLVKRSLSNFKKFTTTALKNGKEGIVIKNLNSNSLFETVYRCKPPVTIDYVIVGYNISKSKSHEGMIKSIIGGLYFGKQLIGCCNVGNMTTSTRQYISNNKNALIGKIFEAKGKRIEESGALRHPSFVRFRCDKKAKDCKMLIKRE